MHLLKYIYVVYMFVMKKKKQFFSPNIFCLLQKKIFFFALKINFPHYFMQKSNLLNLFHTVVVDLGRVVAIRLHYLYPQRFCGMHFCGLSASFKIFFNFFTKPSPL